MKRSKCSVQYLGANEDGTRWVTLELELWDRIARRANAARAVSKM